MHSPSSNRQPNQQAFTMIELLVVIAILALLILLALFAMRGQIAKAQDARDKKNLTNLKVAFEDYYNDNSCYPPPEWFDSSDDCDTNQLAPYLDKIPCNEVTGQPYTYEYDDPTCPTWHKLLTNLNYPDESLFVTDGSGRTDYNYGVSSTNTSVKIDPSVADEGSGGAAGDSGGSYYCFQVGQYPDCNDFDRNAEMCTPNYTDFNCDGGCADKVQGSCTPI
jgi:prepilin-type N-terminal cleavage/methylation domain-containing protein